MIDLQAVLYIPLFFVALYALIFCVHWWTDVRTIDRCPLTGKRTHERPYRLPGNPNVKHWPPRCPDCAAKQVAEERSKLKDEQLSNPQPDKLPNRSRSGYKYEAVQNEGRFKRDRYAKILKEVAALIIEEQAASYDAKYSVSRRIKDLAAGYLQDMNRACQNMLSVAGVCKFTPGAFFVEQHQLDNAMFHAMDVVNEKKIFPHKTVDEIVDRMLHMEREAKTNKWRPELVDGMLLRGKEQEMK